MFILFLFSTIRYRLQEYHFNPTDCYVVHVIRCITNCLICSEFRLPVQNQDNTYSHCTFIYFVLQ